MKTKLVRKQVGMDVNSTEMGGLTFRQSSILCVQFHADQKLLLGVFLALMLYDDYAVVHLAVFLSFGFCALIASHHITRHITYQHGMSTWQKLRE